MSTQTASNDTFAKVHTAPRDEPLSKLRSQIASSPAAWRTHILRNIGEWPTSHEKIEGETFRYFVGGEAFNWKRLAERMVSHLKQEMREPLMLSQMEKWLLSDHPTGGMAENAFRNLLGVAKWRAHLNYFYGVQLERSLILSVQQSVAHRRFSRGLPLDDDSLEDAFERLYEQDRHTLWQQFLDVDPAGFHDLDDWEAGDLISMAVEDEFTYWLFKKRLNSTHPEHMAHETRRGLEMMDIMRDADTRRARMMKNESHGDLIEFGVVSSGGNASH